jgi:uncharacterized protein
MLKPCGALCNLGCRYCFYLAKEELYPGGSFRMSDALLEEYTRQYIAAQQAPEVTFAWQGGEPTLMGLDFFRRAVELQEKYRRPGMRVLNAFQTNGILLDDAWCRFFHDHNFLIGLSLDGPQALHDAYRVDKAGRPTHARVMAGLALLKKHRVEFNILCCVHAANAGRPLEVYRFLRDVAAAQFIQFIPVVESDLSPNPSPLPSQGRACPELVEGGAGGVRSVSGRQFGEFLIAIFDEWVRRDVGRVFVQTFDVALGAWCGQRPGLCVFDETCGLGLALEHNGDLYSCDHFVASAHRLGNILETPLPALVGSEQQRRFGLAKRETLPRYCRACPVRFICNGECPKNRVLLTPDGEPGLNWLCEGYRAFFAHIDRPMKAMASLLRAGRAPAEIMRIIAQEDTALERAFARAERNDPCPCGSGRKFKQCHGRSRPARGAAAV